MRSLACAVQYNRLHDKLILAFIGVLLSASSVFAQDWSSLYTQTELVEQESKYHYRQEIPRYTRDFIWSALRLDETQRLGNVTLEFPWRGARGAPFDFYADRSRQTIVLPIQSLKFMSDLATAISWFGTYRCDETPLHTYMMLLGSMTPQEFNGEYESPMEALGIPVNARDNPEVDHVANVTYESGLVFVLCHELAHLLYHHPGNLASLPRSISRENEMQADSFALELMSRAAIPPLGMAALMVEQSYFAADIIAFGNDADWEKYQTHPLWVQRVSKLTQSMQAMAPEFSRKQPNPSQTTGGILQCGATLQELATYLADVDLIASELTLARARGVRYLKRACLPQRIGELAGLYDFTMSHPGFPDVVAQMELEQAGEQVSGIYVLYGGTQGVIRGSLVDNRLLFEWELQGLQGSGILSWSQGSTGVMTGTWGYGFSRINCGPCQAVRRR